MTLEISAGVIRGVVCFSLELFEACAKRGLCPPCLIRESCQGCLYCGELLLLAHKGTGAGTDLSGEGSPLEQTHVEFVHNGF